MLSRATQLDRTPFGFSGRSTLPRTVAKRSWIDGSRDNAERDQLERWPILRVGLREDELADELADEVAAAGLHVDEFLGIQGPGCLSGANIGLICSNGRPYWTPRGRSKANRADRSVQSSNSSLDNELAQGSEGLPV